MKRTIILTAVITVFFLEFINAQDDIQIGSPNATRPAASGALYDYSVTNTINIKVQLWGYVRFPGFYILP